MNSLATTVTPSTQNPEQPQQRLTAKEIVAANVKTILAILKRAGGWHPGLHLKIDNPPLYGVGDRGDG